MVPVLNAPVRAEGAGVETDLTGVAADLLTRRPQTGWPSRRSGAKPGRRRRSAAATRGPAGVEDLDQSMLLATPPVAVEGVVLGAEPGQCFMQGGLVLLHLDQEAIAGLGGPRESVLLTMQGIGGEQHAGQAQVLHQRPHGRDLAGRPGPL